MALIKCSECAREISDKAELCPGCGLPMRSKSTSAPPSGMTNSVRVERAGLMWEVIGFVLILIAIFSFFSGAPSFACFFGVTGFVVFLIGRFID